MLRTRLFLNLLPFMVMLAAVGGFGIVLFSRLANRVDMTVARNYRDVLAAQAMSVALAGMQQEAWAVAGRQTAASKLFAQHQQRFESNLAVQLEGIPKTRSGEGWQLVTNYQAFKAAMMKMTAAAGPESQRQVYEQELVPSGLRLNRLLEKKRKLNHQAILDASAQIQKVNLEASRLMGLGIVIALLISGYASYRLSRSILRPIQSLTKATRDLTEGSWGRPVPVTTEDELGELATAFNRMAARLQEYRLSTTAELVHLHRAMETTLSSFPDPIFVLDRTGGIELKNPAADELATSLRLTSELPGRLKGLAQKALRTGESYLPDSFKEVISYRVTGADKFFLPRILAMRDKEDSMFGVAVVLHDVTRFRLLDAAKTNLAATVSHELKTPLTSLRMTLHILLEKTLGPLAPKQEELLVAGRDDTERLLRILNNLLDLARLDEGNADLRIEPIAPAELLQQALTELVDSASAKGLRLTSAVDPGLPPVAVDRQRISHVFSNLLTNAIKHSSGNGEIRLSAASAGNGSVQFSVTDEGPGIAEAYQSRIFDRFFRVPGQTRSGAGLGLSIAREITVAHGGRIGVKSSPGHGSTFYVVLNAADSAT
jgi:signal transduction histidine kinase